MKRINVDYFGSMLLMIPTILIMGGGFFVIRIGYSYTPNYRLDFTGLGFILGGILVVMIGLWELIIILNFLKYDFNKQLIVSDSEIKLKVGAREKVYKLHDLKEIELVNEVFGTRMITAHLTYSKLKFANSDVVIVTSLISSTYEVEKQFSYKGVKKLSRSRKPFQLIN